jgi:probable rRNA maturation factor
MMIVEIYCSVSLKKLPYSLDKIESVVICAGKKMRDLTGEVTVSLVGEKCMRSLNKKYRKSDKTTDVLSFSYSETGFFPDKKNQEFGELILCPEYIKKQSKRFGVEYDNEFMRMLMHGLLHLAGYDHIDKINAKKMFVLQESLLVEITYKVFGKKIMNYPVVALEGRTGFYLH